MSKIDVKHSRNVARSWEPLRPHAHSSVAPIKRATLISTTRSDPAVISFSPAPVVSSVLSLSLPLPPRRSTLCSIPRGMRYRYKSAATASLSRVSRANEEGKRSYYSLDTSEDEFTKSWHLHSLSPLRSHVVKTNILLKHFYLLTQIAQNSKSGHKMS